eukprot:jgi/Galph1/4413/GphlegSOOS_G3121.1
MSTKVIFSDLDGTLLHYPEHLERFIETLWFQNDYLNRFSTVVPVDETRAVVRYKDSGEERVCVPVPSSTRGSAYISMRTFELINHIREKGIIFVYVTGARSTTFESRRHLLPQVDFEVCESGGRITRQGKEVDWNSYIMQQINLDCSEPANQNLIPLWETYRLLQGEGFHVDARGYLTQFRLDLSNADPSLIKLWKEKYEPSMKARNLQVVYNLNKIDILPSISGKKNAAKYILDKLRIEPSAATCLMDDENDLDLAKYCGQVIVIGISHPRVAQELELYASQWRTVRHQGVLATEEALEYILTSLDHCLQMR